MERSLESKQISRKSASALASDSTSAPEEKEGGIEEQASAATAPSSVALATQKRGKRAKAGATVKKPRELTFYFVVYTKIDNTNPDAPKETVKRKEFNGIVDAYKHSMLCVKNLKGRGITLNRGGARGAGRMWESSEEDDKIKHRIAIEKERRPEHAKDQKA